MASCSNCGVGLPESAHSCPVCGAHVDVDGTGALFTQGFDQALGFDQAVTTTIEPNRAIPPWLGVLGGVGLVGLLAWMLTRTPADAGPVDQALVPTTVAQSTTSGADAGPSEVSIVPAAASDTTVPLDHAYHMSVPKGPFFSREPATAAGVAPGSPLLGQPVGASLFLGGRSLFEVDLDSGAVTRYEVEGVPVFADRQWLVLQDGQASLAAVPRSDLTAEPRPLFSDGWVQAVLPDGEGYVWVFSQPTDPLSLPIPKWTSVSLNDGSVRASIQLSDAFVFGVTPTVTGTVSGGVFVLEPDRQSYRRIADGSPLVPTDRFVLVRRCASPVDCSNSWVDRSSGREVDRFVPPLDTIWTLSASPSGSFVSSKGPDGWSLWDIERGVLAETLPFNDRGDTGAAFSPDGRLAAVATTFSANRGQVVIHDALTGTRTLIALPQGTFSTATMTFAPAP